MRRMVNVVGAAALLFVAVSSGLGKTPPAAKSGPPAIVLVFKDGHRQSFNLSDVARVEFAGGTGQVASDVVPAGPGVALRGHFIGRWDVGDGNGGNFFITLDQDGTARRSLGNVRGKWVYADGAALITWDDGAQDAIRKTGSLNQKFAYAQGKSFSDEPDNVTSARNIAPRPI